MDNHSTFIISIVVIIVIFLLVLLATMTLSKESFQNLQPLLPAKYKKVKQKFLDTIVPQNLKIKNSTERYKKLEDGLNGTSLVNVTDVISNRHPISIETSTNWYSTQPIPSMVGTNMGK